MTSRRFLPFAATLCLAAVLPLPVRAETAAPPAALSSVERIKTSHLRAAHEDALRYAKERRELPPLPGLQDYKAILHAHAEDSAHTGGTRPEMLADAKRAGVKVILLTDHLRPPRDFIKDSWRGLHEGVLFIPGSEARGFLIYPCDSIMDRIEQPIPQFISTVTAGDGLIFLSHIEERPEHAMDGLNGLEIYNRHYDAKKDMALLIAIAMKLLAPEQLAELQENLARYPDELLAAQVTYQTEYIGKWDRETQKRRLTGVAANDCHHNQVFVAKVADANTVLIGTSVDKDEGMRRLSAESYPQIRALTKGRQPGDVLARVDFDPYFRAFRNVTTHLLAPELTEDAVRRTLRQGHAFISHDWMCDATGFTFTWEAPAVAGSKPASALMGDEAAFQAGAKLVAHFPLRCRIRLLSQGQVVSEAMGDQLEFSVDHPGVYRVEGWLKLDGEDRPWIYSNPIYVRP